MSFRRSGVMPSYRGAREGSVHRRRLIVTITGPFGNHFTFLRKKLRHGSRLHRRALPKATEARNEARAKEHGMVGPQDLWIAFALGVFFFGAKKLPELSRSLG
jgi:hypothetical protein